MREKQNKINYKNKLIESGVSRLLLFLVLSLLYFMIDNLTIAIIFISISLLFSFALLLSFLINNKNKNKNKKIFLFLLFPLFPYKTAIKLIKEDSSESLDSFIFQQNISSFFSILIWTIPIILSSILIFEKNLLFFILIFLICLLSIFWNLIKIIFNFVNAKDQTKNKIFCTIYLCKQINEKKDFIISVIDENNGILTYKELNKNVKISQSDLNKLIIKNKGMNFKEYSLNLKMQYAKEMMEHTNFHWWNF